MLGRLVKYSDANTYPVAVDKLLRAQFPSRAVDDAFYTLQDVLANNDMELNDQVLITLMRRYDVAKDGNIAYEDLLKI